MVDGLEGKPAKIWGICGKFGRGGQNDSRFGMPPPCLGGKSGFAGSPPPRRGETTTVMGWKRDRSAAALAGCPVARLPGCPQIHSWL
jgi:hypothetical protein